MSAQLREHPIFTKDRFVRGWDMMCEGNSGSSLRLFMAGFWGEYLLVEIDSFAILLE
jgi:hypothetical protein